MRTALDPNDINHLTDVNIDYYQAGMLNDLADAIHARNVEAGWWTDLKTGEPLDRNVAELLCLVHSEVSEAMEGHRKDLMDDKLPTRKMLAVELADVMIRIFDLAGAGQMDLGGALIEKLAYNKHRQDHQPAARMSAGGKAF
jgi:NTP pyrophosphatase (non-canonical NTP hydrolase)